ncbi:MAG TPA: hypothetical protein PK668_09270 [Myxococcota bacterium]|nr:hypothetical protein [Myxococcota bacterium]HRY92829.1 hypothetical protein [Myxococcota bacterium]HSA24327.1 hypothetical protein [Myxococcota bacterium]
MGLGRRVGGWLARRPYIRRALDERADLSTFRQRPSRRLLTGLGVLAVSMLLGWPAVGALAGLAVYLREPLIGLVGGPAVYAFSWVLYGAALWIGGPDVLRYMNAFSRWALRRLTERLQGPPAGAGG